MTVPSQSLAQSTDQLGLSQEVMVKLAPIVAALSPARLQAWLTCGERIVAGMPVTEAERRMWAEIAAAEAGS